MWSMLWAAIGPRHLGMDGIGGANVRSMANFNAGIKTIKQSVAKADVNNDGKIAGDEAKVLQAAIGDKFTLGIAKELMSPPVEKAQAVLTKIKNGEPLDKADLVVLDAAAKAIAAKMAPLIKAEKVQLDPGQETNLKTAIEAKPYLKNVFSGMEGGGGVPSQRLNAYLHSLQPAEKGNGIRSELAKDMAMDNLRTKYMKDPDQQAGYTKLGLNTDPTKASTFKAANFNPSDSDLKDPKMVAQMKDALLHHPDVPLAEKHAALAKLGVTDIKERNKLIEGARSEAVKEIDKEGAKFFKALGGGGIPPRTEVLSTGDGTGTLGLKGVSNACVSFFEYGAPTKINVGNQGWQEAAGIGTRTATYPIDDPKAATPIHLSAVGANNGTGNPNQVTIEQKDAKGVKKSYTLDVYQEAGQTKMRVAADSLRPPGWDASTQSFTLPPSPYPVSIQQRSNAGDEYQVTTAVFNTKPEKLELDLSDVFAPNQFRPDIKPGSAVDQDVKAIAAYVKKHPETTFPTNLTGMGAVTMKDGQRMPASDFPTGTGYSASGDNTEAKLRSCRYSGLDIDFTTNQISIVSSTDPVRATISVDGARNTTPELNKLVKEFRDANPGKNLTDNQVLSGLRAFAILEAVQKELGATPDLLKNAKVTVGDGVQMNFEQYKTMRAAAPVPKPSS